VSQSNEFCCLTLCVASQRVFIVVVDFVIDSFWIHPRKYVHTHTHTHTHTQFWLKKLNGLEHLGRGWHNFRWEVNMKMEIKYGGVRKGLSWQWRDR
jgi:hypothetical protein